MTEPRTERRHVLPPSLPPRGLSRVEAAAYVGVSPSLFDKLVTEGTMPKAFKVKSRAVWDRLKLDLAFAALDGQDGEANPWDT